MNPSTPFLSNNQIPFYTFGCMSLGGDPDRFQDDVKVARMAMEHPIWFHASQEYSCAFWVIRQAFDEARSKTPRLILKIRCDHAATIKHDVEDALQRLNVERVDIAQLCRARHDHRRIVDDFLNKGEMWEVCEKLKQEGKVGGFIMEVFASFSSDALRAVQAGLFPAYITYLSPGERQMNNELFHLIEKKQQPILSLRTVFGGRLQPEVIERIRKENPSNSTVARFDALEPIFIESGCKSRVEFCFSFLKTYPNLQTTIAGTSNPAHLMEFIDASRDSKPMESALADRIKKLHDQWSENP